MSLSDGNQTKYFTVVGAAYVPEQHGEHPARTDRDRDTSRQPETGVASLWLVFYGAIIVLSLINVGAAKLQSMASLVLN